VSCVQSAFYVVLKSPTRTDKLCDDYLTYCYPARSKEDRRLKGWSTALTDRHPVVRFHNVPVLGCGPLLLIYILATGREEQYPLRRQVCYALLVCVAGWGVMFLNSWLKRNLGRFSQQNVCTEDAKDSVCVIQIIIVCKSETLDSQWFPTCLSM